MELKICDPEFFYLACFQGSPYCTHMLEFQYILLLNNVLLCAYMCICMPQFILFIHLFIDGYLGCSHLSDDADAAMCMGAQVLFESLFSVIWG